ncbi:MAG: glycosyltransferase family 9 protein [Phycisphaeraceae bacterium]|nr:glycosyltransferase family 9 protein [Phycisphaeraceae bacterium]
MSTAADSPGKILIIRPSALGDVCRSVPVLVSLRRAFPDAAIDWLVQDTFAPAIAAHPDLSSVIPFPRRRFGDWWRGRPGVELAAWLRNLRRARYDLVLDCQGLARSGAFAWATGAPRRLGYAEAPEGAWLAYTQRVSAPRDHHAVDRMLALADAAGARIIPDLRLHAPPADRDALAADPRLANARFALLAPTSRWPGKRWPAERFARVSSALLDHPGGGIDAVVLVGSSSERDQCGPLLDLAANDRRLVDRIGATSVGGLMALIERSALVIANDSAALHMAVGFDRPLVGLFGPTRADLVGPYRRADAVIQHVTPADRLDHKNEAVGRALMERLHVDEVLALALSQLQSAPTPSR